MKSIISFGALACASLLFIGCSKSGGTTPVPLPEFPVSALVTVTTTWTGISSDATKPSAYKVAIGSSIITAYEDNTVSANKIPFGTYKVMAYNEPKGITISGESATVNSNSDGTIVSNPGHLFFGEGDLTFASADAAKITIAMKQFTRKITFVLVVNGDINEIKSTTATMNGIASAVNLATGVISSTSGKSIALTFTKGTITKSAAGVMAKSTTKATVNVISADAIVIGTQTGSTQNLTVNITLPDNTTQSVSSNMTSVIASAMTAGSAAAVTAEATLTLPSAANVSATISDWSVVNGGDINLK
jgi:hypothetical protein